MPAHQLPHRACTKLPEKWHLEVVRPSIPAAAAQRYRRTMCSSCQRCTAVVTSRDLPTLSRTKRRPAAATQALSSGEVPTAVALHASLVTLNEIEGFGRKKTAGFSCSSPEDVWLRWLARKPGGFLSPYGRRSYSAPTLWRATFQLVVGICSCFHRNRCVRL